MGRTPFELSGARVVVTGGSRGIGEALARSFAARGATVVVVARSAGPLEAVADRTGGVAVVADLGDPAVLDGLVARIEAEHGPVDVWVNNAGVEVAGGLLATTTTDDEAVLRLNTLVPMALTRQAVAAFAPRRRGVVVNVSSFAGFVPFPGMASYAASKAALTQFTEVVRSELHGTGVRAVLVELGPVPTDMLDGVESYEPTRASFDRFARIRLSVDVPRERVADEVVRAVAEGRDSVRLPRRGAPFAALQAFPRWFSRVLLTGVPRR